MNDRAEIELPRPAADGMIVFGQQAEPDALRLDRHEHKYAFHGDAGQMQVFEGVGAGDRAGVVHAFFLELQAQTGAQPGGDAHLHFEGVAFAGYGVVVKGERAGRGLVDLAFGLAERDRILALELKIPGFGLEVFGFELIDRGARDCQRRLAQSP